MIDHLLLSIVICWWIIMLCGEKWKDRRAFHIWSELKYFFEKLKLSLWKDDFHAQLNTILFICKKLIELIIINRDRFIDIKIIMIWHDLAKLHLLRKDVGPGSDFQSEPGPRLQLLYNPWIAYLGSLNAVIRLGDSQWEISRLRIFDSERTSIGQKGDDTDFWINMHIEREPRLCLRTNSLVWYCRRVD